MRALILLILALLGGSLPLTPYSGGDTSLTFPGVHQALAFLVSWPALDKAANLVTERSAELDGNHYEILSPAADALAAKHPLAATLLLRAMIDFALKENRVKRARSTSNCKRR